MAKTVASQVPFLSALVEASNQLEGWEVERRVVALEEELRSNGKASSDVEKTPEASRRDVSGWPLAVSEYLKRMVTIGCIYDGGYHSSSKGGRELVQPLAQACLIGAGRFVTSAEAQQLAIEVAREKGGNLVVLCGMAFHSLTFTDAHRLSGIVTGTVGPRDEKKWNEVIKRGLEHKVTDIDDAMIRVPVKYSLRPLIGEECGVIHSGEATNVMWLNSQYSRVQFDTFTISHFHKPKEDALIKFVSGVLPGRILQPGSPVFNRSGELVGVLSDTESYESDAGRRAVVRGLLNHPEFPQITA